MTLLSASPLSLVYTFNGYLQLCFWINPSLIKGSGSWRFSTPLFLLFFHNYLPFQPGIEQKEAIITRHLLSQTRS